MTGGYVCSPRPVFSIAPSIASGNDAWRFSNFEEWRQSIRRDAAECVDLRITAEHFAALKKVNLNTDSLACLTGAFVSPKAHMR